MTMGALFECQTPVVGSECGKRKALRNWLSVVFSQGIERNNKINELCHTHVCIFVVLKRSQIKFDNCFFL